MKGLFKWFAVGLLVLAANSLIRYILGVSSVDTSYALLEFIWFSGVSLTLYGFFGVIYKLITKFIIYDVRSRFQFFSTIFKFFRYIVNPWSSKNSDKIQDKYKKVIWGIAILFSIGSFIGLIYSSN